MLSPDQSFLLLCAGEIGVVLLGFVSIPAVVVLQVEIIVLLIIFRKLSRPVPFIAAVVVGTITYAAILVSFRHTLLPLVLLGTFSSLGILSLILAEARLQRLYGGAA
jgi:hypothetical protein